MTANAIHRDWFWTWVSRAENWKLGFLKTDANIEQSYHWSSPPFLKSMYKKTLLFTSYSNTGTNIENLYNLEFSLISEIQENKAQDLNKL